MSKLLVREIDLSESGSYRKRKQFLKLLKRLRESQTKDDPDTIITALDEAEQLILGQLATDDGSPVEPLLDQLSAQQFDELLSAIAFRTGVGEASKPSSTAGPEGTVENIQTG